METLEGSKLENEIICLFPASYSYEMKLFFSLTFPFPRFSQISIIFSFSEIISLPYPSCEWQNSKNPENIQMRECGRIKVQRNYRIELWIAGIIWIWNQNEMNPFSHSFAACNDKMTFIFNWRGYGLFSSVFKG